MTLQGIWTHTMILYICINVYVAMSGELVFFWVFDLVLCDVKKISLGFIVKCFQLFDVIMWIWTVTFDLTHRDSEGAFMTILWSEFIFTCSISNDKLLCSLLFVLRKRYFNMIWLLMNSMKSCRGQMWNKNVSILGGHFITVRPVLTKFLLL